jgi:hypothetical protein
MENIRETQEDTFQSYLEKEESSPGINKKKK